MTSNSAPTYTPGTPSWVDLGSSDLPKSSQFYSELFGWQAEDLGDQFGHYHTFRQDGKMVAGAGPLMTPQQPVVWSTYICTKDVVATAKAVREAGGSVMLEPMAVMELGSMAVFVDPAGAVFSAWQPGQHKGAELANTPNSFCWNELATRDLDGAKGFYPRVFGWDVKANEMPGMGEYVEWLNDGKSIAGAYGMGDRFPPQVPAHWLVYFAVANTDATVETAQTIGGKVVAAPVDIPQGRFAILSDPLGATFGIIKI